MQGTGRCEPHGQGWDSPRLTYSAIADNPEGGEAGKRWWEVVRMVEGASRTGDNGAVGAVGTVRVMGAVR